MSQNVNSGKFYKRSETIFLFTLESYSDNYCFETVFFSKLTAILDVLLDDNSQEISC